jgi:hypothetical protein
MDVIAVTSTMNPIVTRRLGVALTVLVVGAGLSVAPQTDAATPVASPAVAPGTAGGRQLATDQAPAERRLSVQVLSGRADLVSGGSALVAIALPGRAAARRVSVRLGGKDVTKRFAIREDGRFEGLVTGLRLGRNVLTARLGDLGARITLTNHPRGGPVFSGPQLEPWVCQATAVDSRCNQPTVYSYAYRSTNPAKTGFQPYDPAAPPSDVEEARTDHGVTVPFIVRTETGYMDRDQYQVTTLYQPRKRWSAVAPQTQFNHKMLVTHGASCGVEHTTASAPATTGSKATDDALVRGYVVMSTALNNSGHNCNVALQAESLVMAKEHVVKNYGTLRWTIGTGCSGGSLAEQWVANAYPGFYQGLLPTCSFPDAYSTATQFLDYHLLNAYFTNPASWDLASGVAWLPTQMADVLGGDDGVVNAQVSDQAQFHVAVPTDPCAGVTDAQRYDPVSNPGGVRCTIHDAAINLFGPQEERFWSANEKKIGRGFVRIPVDNVGVQYGLEALTDRSITAAQFVDLNVKAGGVDIDTNLVPERLDNGRSKSLSNAYRTGLINEANNLDQVAIIDCRGSNPGLFHDAYRAFAIRARLDREHGTHANQVIWEGPVPLLGDTDCEVASFQMMDRWLRRVAADRSTTSLSHKIIADKPAGLTDRCYSGSGVKVSDTLCPSAVVTITGTPRMVAGDAITTDANKCRLEAMDRSSYGSVTFTDAQWAALQKVFTTGVCDFSQPAVLQQDTIAWMTYQDARGRVIYGGRPLGKPPVSRTVRRSP